MNVTRRNFVAGLSMAAMALPGSKVLGANSRVNLGFVGVGGRGSGHVKHFNGLKDVGTLGICDADIGKAEANAKRIDGSTATTEMREIFANPDIDAVVVSTCNHWHVLASIWAIEAGKDVYVEKPVSHNIWEGRQLVQAARKHDRIVQGGTQQRSDPMQTEAKAFIDANLGKLKSVRCNRYGVRGSIGKRDTPLTPPKEVDYNMWLGPAQDVPIFREKFHYDWHWDFNCGNGELGNWGPHILDDLRNVIFRDQAAYPDKVMSGGGRLAWHDAGTSPNTHFTYMEVGGVPVVMDVHNLPRIAGIKGSDVYRKHKSRAFLIAEYENGRYEGSRGGANAYDNDGKKIKTFAGDAGKNHAKNFIDCVRSRKRDDLNAEIEEIHYSSAWCHLGNVSYQLGKKYNEGEAKAALKDNDEWSNVLDDFHYHMKNNKIDMASEDIRLGPLLNIDSANESFVGDTATQEALKLLTREYRTGFEVTKQA